MRFSCLASLVVFLSPAFAECQNAVQPDDAGKSYAIPYLVSDSGHIVVRAKINGQGPFNFIVDTGAPLVFVTAATAKKIELKAEKKGQTTLEEFQLEGGPGQQKVKCVVETPFQLEGMNAMGLAGVELHGILGYSLLAQFKMEIDFTKDRMTWTKLAFTPEPPQPLGAKGGALDQIDALGKFMRVFAALMGNKGVPAPAVRGFVGIELAEKDQAVVVEMVLPQGPAAAAGVKAGDRIVALDGREIGNIKELMAAIAGVTKGQEVHLTVQRGETKQNLTIVAGEGMQP